MPRTLCTKLTRHAESAGVSINNFVTAIIAEAIGSKRSPSENGFLASTGIPDHEDLAKLAM